MAGDTYFTEIKKLTWNAVKKTLLGYTNQKEWLFRGQGSCAWPLATSLSRKALPPRGSRRSIEKTLIHDFRRKMHHFKGQNEHVESDVEVIAYMQHHGAPTRFLDWSSSPYVASYFAYEKCEDDAPCVWAINYWWLVKKNTDILFDIIKERKEAYHGEAIPIDDPRIVEQIINQNSKLITPVSPYHENERIMLQQGTFLLQGEIDSSFEDNFSVYDKAELKSNVIKIILPEKYRIEALNDLKLMNITSSTLYPGIDGFAKSLNVEYELYANRIED